MACIKKYSCRAYDVVKKFVSKILSVKNNILFLFLNDMFIKHFKKIS